GLLAQQEIQPAKIRARQRARLTQQVADVDACSEPSEPEEQRKTEQPPVFEFHVGVARGAAHPSAAGGASRIVARAPASRSSRPISRRCRISIAAAAATPSSAPAAKNASSSATSGACHARSK